MEIDIDDVPWKAELVTPPPPPGVLAFPTVPCGVRSWGRGGWGPPRLGPPPPPACEAPSRAQGRLRIGLGSRGQLRDGAAEHGQLVVLVARLLLDLHEVQAALDELPDDLAVDAEDVALGVVAADLGAGLAGGTGGADPAQAVR